MMSFAGFHTRAYYRWIVVACLCSAALAGLLLPLAKCNKDFTEIPLARNPHINDVSEPITPLDGIILADGGSIGFLYEDSRHVTRGACLEYDTDFREKTLSFGGMVPDERTQVPVGSIQEKSFLGMLQRWQLQDPQTTNEAQRERAKDFAILLIKRLQNRNSCQSRQRSCRSEPAAMNSLNWIGYSGEPPLYLEVEGEATEPLDFVGIQRVTVAAGWHCRT